MTLNKISSKIKQWLILEVYLKYLGNFFNFYKVRDNYIVLQAAFKREDPESTKKTDD